MASWNEIEKFRRDPAAAASVARGLLTLGSDLLSEWEITFLESIASRSKASELSTLQAEKLLEIRDEAVSVSEHKGLSVSFLIHRCYEARLDLPEDDEEWIVHIL